MRRFHFILLSIKLDVGVAIVLDSRRKEAKEWSDMSEMLQNACGRHTGIIYKDTMFASSFATRPLSGAYLTNNLKYERSGTNSYHMIAYEQFKRNW